jgi:3-oxoacyl-[acyl-carrier-protein] synthase II
MTETKGINRVVITGLGVVSPLGCSVEMFWSELLAGKSGITTITDIDLSNCRTRVGARVTGYDARHYFSARDLNRLSLTSQFALVAASQALALSNLDPGQCNPWSVGVILGGSSGGFVAAEPIIESFSKDRIITNPLIIPTAMNNAPASNISIRYGFRGPVMTIDAACASSAHAIGYAFKLIRSGALPIVVTGGVDSSFSPAIFHGWSSLRTLSEHNEAPATACRPFSQDRDGLVLGEGAGILILESESSAQERGAVILAEVTGYGATSDGYHLTQPGIEGISEAMQMALVDANLTANDIDCINAHATATLWNDKVETAAIKQTFGPRAKQIPVVGIKGAIGHSIAASGALGLISAVLSIRDSVIPPTINLKIPDPECDLDYVPEGARSCDPKHVMINSFAFGGSNAVLIASRYETKKQS